MSEFKSVYKKKTSAFEEKKFSYVDGEKTLKVFFSKRKEKRPSRCEYKIQIDHKLRSEKKCVKIYRKYFCGKKLLFLGYKIFKVSPNELNFSFNSPSCDIQQRSSSNHINHLFSHSRMWIHPSTFLLLHEFSSYFLP